jgi:glycosyltransferase involved in cell wall biosynthesis
VVSAASTSPLVTVIIPTFDHPTTLPWAIKSVLDQSLSDFELVLIGDGVTDATRDVVHGVTDTRVRFLDRRKSRSRSELVRDEVIRSSASVFTAYLGDDDLMVPGHLAAMVKLLDDHQFAHSAPVTVLPDGSLRVQPTDLSLPECVEWHLHPEHNAVSLSGVVHRNDAYRTLPRGWVEPPPDRWSDHFMWEQWIRNGPFRFVTSTRVSVLKFDSVIRRDISPVERGAESERWFLHSRREGFPAWLDARSARALLQYASVERLNAEWLVREVAHLNDQIVSRDGDYRRLKEDASTAISALHELRATRTWRVHDKLAHLFVRRD